MRLFVLLCLSLGTTLFAQNSGPPHRSCMQCRVAASVSDENGGQKPASFSYIVCLTCHDGQIAEEPNLPLHLAHAPRRGHVGLDCIACHDPHDRSHSFRLLRSKRGPQTEQSAALDFCRDCHTDH
jgi:hypothetical protein